MLVIGRSFLLHKQEVFLLPELQGIALVMGHTLVGDGVIGGSTDVACSQAGKPGELDMLEKGFEQSGEVSLRESEGVGGGHDAKILVVEMLSCHNHWHVDVGI